MDTYKEQFQKLQKYAFNVLREYPLDKTAVNVLSALVNSKKKDRIEFFKLNKGEDAMKVYYNLADSGTIEKYLETSAFLEYINE